MDIREFNLQPLGNRVIVRPIIEPKLRESGIIIPETVKERAATGRVIAVGSGKMLTTGERHPIDVKVGDVVFYNTYSGNSLASKLRDRGREMNRPEEQYIILDVDSLMAIVIDDSNEEPTVRTD